VHDGQNNAMAEIALALAMAFFSVMVLTMVSMGAGFVEPAQSSPAMPEGVEIRPSTQPPATGEPAPADTAGRRVVIFDGTTFRDDGLADLDPRTIGVGEPAILAVDPALPMTRVLAARKRIPSQDLIVTTLDSRWIEALEEIAQ